MSNEFYDTSSTDYILTLSDPLNNGALDNGKDEITFTAKVVNKEDKTPAEGMTIKFTLEDTQNHAIFTESDIDNKQTSSGVSDDKGEVTRSITDTMAENGEIEAYIEFTGGDKLSATKHFMFVPPPPTLTVTLSNDPSIADGQSSISVTAQLLTIDGVAIQGQLVHFALADSMAIFTDDDAETSADGHSTTSGTTDDQGKVTKPFVDQVWEEGSVTASATIKGSGDPVVVDGQAKFRFTQPPSLQLEILALEAQTKDGEWVEGDSTVADGKSGNKVTLKTTVADINDSTKRKNLANVPVEVNLSKEGHAVFTDKNGDPVYTLQGVTNSVGEFTQTFTCQYIEIGKTETDKAIVDDDIRTVSGAVDGHDGIILSESTLFEFTDPWQDVIAINYIFAGGLTEAAIYANGLHQAKVNIRMQLCSLYNSTPLSNSNQPPIEDVINSIAFIEYDTLTPFGQGDLTGWDTCLIPNIFDKHLKGQNGIAVKDEDDPNRIEDGIAYLSFYITCDSVQKLKQIRIGMNIKPTGNEADVLTVSLHGTEPVTPISLEALLKIVYGGDNIEITYAHLIHGNEVDPYAVESLDNCWRQWNYALRFNDDVQNRYGTTIFQCRLAPSKTMPANYEFSQISSTIYNFKGYFWPVNVYDSNGVPLQQPNQYIMQSPGLPSQLWNAPAESDNDKGTIYFSAYCAFGYINVGGYSFCPVPITLYDQYGNTGDYTVFPNNLPSTYSVEAFDDWDFIIPGHLNEADTGDKGYWPESMNIRSFLHEGYGLYVRTDFDIQGLYPLSGKLGDNEVKYRGKYIFEYKDSCTFIVRSDFFASANYLYPTAFYNALGKAVYSVNNKDISGTGGAVSSLKPVWVNNTFVIQAYINSTVSLTEPESWAETKAYIEGSKEFEFTLSVPT